MGQKYKQQVKGGHPYAYYTILYKFNFSWQYRQLCGLIHKHKFMMINS